MPKVVPEYKEQARMRIIEESLKMFSERGFNRTRMTDIANSLGVSKGAIYQYFESKDQLFIEALKHHGEKRARVVRGFLKSGSLKSISSGEFFDEMLELRLSSLPLNADLLRETKRNTELTKLLGRVIEEWGKGLIDLINEMRRKGDIRVGVDPSSLSRGILALRDGLYGHLMMGADKNDVKKTWVDIMSLLMIAVLNGDKSI